MLVFILFFNLEFWGVVFCLMILLSNPSLDVEYSNSFMLTDMGFWMKILVIVMYLMMISTDMYYKTSLNFLLVLLFFLMSVSSIVVYYLMYEMIFIFIMFAIIFLGYSYERLMASYLMLFYSFLFSSPVLLIILMMDKVFLVKNWVFYSVLLNYFLLLSFSVKFPIFGFHYWLPVAHVEASTIGSMILAGVLLKLGCMGVFYLINYMYFSVKFHWLALSVLLVMLMITYLTDLKMMIAYSSVAHMTLVFYVMMMGSTISKMGALMMMFYHGFVSPVMFWVIGLLAWWKTRSLLVVKMMSFSYLFILLLFFMVILNMGFPPFMGFMSEILMLKSLLTMNYVVYVFIISVLFSCYYNVYLFWVFNNFLGGVFKLTFYSVDMFIFLLFSIFINMY